MARRPYEKPEVTKFTKQAARRARSRPGRAAGKAPKPLTPLDYANLETDMLTDHGYDLKEHRHYVRSAWKAAGQCGPGALEAVNRAIAAAGRTNPDYVMPAAITLADAAQLGETRVIQVADTIEGLSKHRLCSNIFSRHMADIRRSVK